MGNYNKKEYIIRSYKGSRELYNYFWKLTERLNLDDSDPAQKTLRKAYHKLLVHIFVGTKVRKKRNKQAGIEVEIPVSWELIARKLHRRIRVQKLRECGLIQIKGYFHGPQGGKSREYRLSYKVFGKAIQLEADLFITNWSDLITKSKVPSMVDIFTGKNKYTRQQTQVSLYSNSIKFYNIPDLIKNSIKNSLDSFPFNPHKIIPWLEKIRSKADRSRKKLTKEQVKLQKKYPEKKPKDITKMIQEMPIYKEYRKANGLFIATLSSLTAILNQGIKKTKLKTTDGKEIWEYKTAYTIQEFGRVSEIHGGFQILSKVGKKYLMENVPNLFNYDLKNSQAYILLQEFKASGIKCQWLDDYLDDSNAKTKKTCAAEVGISIGCWKDCFYATVMGALFFA